MYLISRDGDEAPGQASTYHFISLQPYARSSETFYLFFFLFNLLWIDLTISIQCLLLTSLVAYAGQATSVISQVELSMDVIGN